MTVTQQIGQDARIKPGQCHEPTTIAGHEFICIAPPHRDRPTGAWSLEGALARARTPLSRRHFFIRRYPGGGR